MKKMVLIVSIVALIPSISFAQAAEKQTIRITLDVVKKNEKMISIVGTTNLPNGEKIAIEIAPTLFKERSFGDVTVVANGQFKMDIPTDQPVAYKIKAQYYGQRLMMLGEKPIAEGQVFFGVGTKEEQKTFLKKIRKDLSNIRKTYNEIRGFYQTIANGSNAYAEDGDSLKYFNVIDSLQYKMGELERKECNRDDVSFFKELRDSTVCWNLAILWDLTGSITSGRNSDVAKLEQHFRESFKESNTKLLEEEKSFKQ